MEHIVLVRFKDLQDDGFVYNAGDRFPRVGVKVSAERLEELSTTKNRRHLKLIKSIPGDNKPGEAIPVPGETPQEAETDANPSEASEPQEKSKKTPKRGSGSKRNARADS